ncbi:MAG: hypothetical protein KGL46_03870 [Hyphomicrobiales bacterium]|nr:hypothetical protein [Hyphomicrobiales bacterium]
MSKPRNRMPDRYTVRIAGALYTVEVCGFDRDKARVRIVSAGASAGTDHVVPIADLKKARRA